MVFRINNTEKVEDKQEQCIDQVQDLPKDLIKTDGKQKQHWYGNTDQGTTITHF